MEMQLKQEERQVTIYSQRSHMFKLFIFLAAFDCLALFCLFEFLFSVFSTISSFPTTPAYGIAIICSVYSIVFAIFFLLLPPFGWFTFIVIQNWLLPQSILNINEQGITIYAQPIIKRAFFPWNNIEKLHLIRSSSFRGTNLYLVPREKNQLFSSRFQRLCWRWFAARGFFLGAWLLKESDEELSAQIRRGFGNELSQYEIQLED